MVNATAHSQKLNNKATVGVSLVISAALTYKLISIWIDKHSNLTFVNNSNIISVLINICKDIYLRIQMNPESRILLTLIDGFNRVRGLTSDMSLVRKSLALSKILDHIQEKDILRKKGG